MDCGPGTRRGWAGTAWTPAKVGRGRTGVGGVGRWDDADAEDDRPSGRRDGRIKPCAAPAAGGSTGGRTRTRTRTHSHSDQPCSTTEADQDRACVTACDTLPAFRVRLRLACVGLLSAPSTASLDASIRSPQIKVLQPIQPWPSSSAPHSFPRSRRVWPRTTSRPRSSALVSPMT